LDPNTFQALLAAIQEAIALLPNANNSAQMAPSARLPLTRLAPQPQV
jgi:hypothetical protein